jgi:hypothetical protein
MGYKGGEKETKDKSKTERESSVERLASLGFHFSLEEEEAPVASYIAREQGYTAREEKIFMRNGF